MDHPLHELEEVLSDLERARRRDTDEHGPSPAELEMMVVAREPPSRGLYSHLRDLGVTATIALPWTPADPVASTLSAKVGAMEAWADSFMS